MYIYLCVNVYMYVYEIIVYESAAQISYMSQWRKINTPNIFFIFFIMISTFLSHLGSNFFEVHLFSHQVNKNYCIHRKPLILST